MKSEGRVSDDFTEKMLKKLDAQSCYILDKPVQLTPKEWEKWWWEDYHPWCTDCEYDCKQSRRVEIHNCRMLQEKRKR